MHIFKMRIVAFEIFQKYKRRNYTGKTRFLLTEQIFHILPCQ
jgi:hypothetical protein